MSYSQHVIILLLGLAVITLVVIAILLGRALSTLTLIMLNAGRIRQVLTPDIPHMLDYQPPSAEAGPSCCAAAKQAAADAVAQVHEPDYSRHPDSNFPDMDAGAGAGVDEDEPTDRSDSSLRRD